MFRKVNLIILVLFTFLFIGKVNASHIEPERLNHWYYKIEDNNKISYMPVMSYTNTYSNRYVFMLSISYLNIEYFNTTTIKDNVLPFDKIAFLDSCISAYYGIRKRDINTYAFVQKMIWEVLYPNIKVTVVDFDKNDISDAYLYINDIIKNKDEYDPIYKEVVIESNDNKVYLSDYSNNDYILNDLMYVEDNKVYLENYVDDEEYKILSNTVNNGYIYYNDSDLALEVFSMPSNGYIYKVKKIDNNVKEEITTKVEDNKEEIVIENEEEDKKVEDNNIVVEDDKLPSQEIVKNKVNVSTKKKDVIKDEKIDYVQDNKGALVYSESKEEEKIEPKKQSSIWLVLVVFLMLLIRKFIRTIKRKISVKAR